MHRVRLAEPRVAHPRGYALAQNIQQPLDILPAVDVLEIGERIAHRFESFPLVGRAHRLAVLAARITGQGRAPFAEMPHEQRRLSHRQLSDRADAQFFQFFRRRFADVQQLRYGQRPDLLPKIVRADKRDGIRLFQIGGKFCKDFIEADADRNGQVQLLLHGGADLFRDLFAAPEYAAVCHVQPAFVDAERLDPVGEAPVDLPHRARLAFVLGKTDGADDQSRAFALRRPDHVARPHAELFGLFAFGEDDAVPRFLVAAHGERLARKLREQLDLDRRVKVVQVRV